MSEEISPSQATLAADNARDINREAHFSQFDNSVNAVSFGFVATAILVSMFLVMALFEKFLRPTSSSSSEPPSSSQEAGATTLQSTIPTHCMDKLEEPSISTYSVGVSVVMPGDQIPTFIAHPAPMPCPAEGGSWPINGEDYLGPSSLVGVFPKVSATRATMGEATPTP